MPAIQLDQLNKKITVLTALVDRPTEFVSKLHDLLSFYADHSSRQIGRIPKNLPLTPAYQVPRPLLRRIIQAIHQKTSSIQTLLLPLCDALWEENNLECRLIAAELLGRLRPDSPALITERLEAWGQKTSDTAILNTLFEAGTDYLRKQKPDQLLALARKWLYEKDSNNKRFALKILRPLIQEAGFENLPAVYNLLTPLIYNPQHELIADILNVIRALIWVSPKETAYFLKQFMMPETSPKTKLLLRQCISLFPEEMQPSLKAALPQ